MSWINFIIVPKLKLIVEAPRALDGDLWEGKLSDYIKEQLEGLDGQQEFGDNGALFEIEEKPCLSITIADLQVMQRSLREMIALREASYEVFLLYWLEKKEIEYQVFSEHAMEGKEFPKDYIKVSLFNDEGKEEDLE